MLDVLARSQRARLCEYSREKGGPKLSTPCVIVSEGDDACIKVTEGGRTLSILGTEVPLESGLLRTASSGMPSEPCVREC